MTTKLLLTTTAILLTTWASSAQCLRGGCKVGLSSSEAPDGVFIGNYEDGIKSGLGIVYSFNPKGTTTSYVNYVNDKKSGVEYRLERDTISLTDTHIFRTYSNNDLIYPSLRLIKNGNKTLMDVEFSEGNGWEKYDGDTKKGNLEVKSLISDGTPQILAINDGSLVMGISTTISSIDILTTIPTEKYYNGLELSSNNDRTNITIYPRAGSDKTIFRSKTDWNMKNYKESTWFYKRYFNNKLSYYFSYEDVLELPSQQEVKQRKVQEAFDYVAEQVNDYDFDKGYEGRAKDFIDTLNDIKSRAQLKGYDIPYIYDITMVELNLRNGDKDQSIVFAQSAYDKSAKSLEVLQKLLDEKFTAHVDLLTMIKSKESLVINED